MKKKLTKLTKILLIFVMIFSQLSTVCKVLADEIDGNPQIEEPTGENENNEENLGEEPEDDEETTEEEPTDIFAEERAELVSKLEEIYPIEDANMIFNAKNLEEYNVVLSTKELYESLEEGITAKLNGNVIDENTEEVLLKNNDVVEFSTENVSVSYTVIVMGDITDDSTFTDEDITSTMEGYLEEDNIPSMDLYRIEEEPFGTITFEDVMLLNGYRERNKEENTDIELNEEESNLELELNLDKDEYYVGDEIEVSINLKEIVKEEEITNEELEEKIKDYINGIIGNIEYAENLELVDIKLNEVLLNAIKDNNFIAAGDKLFADDTIVTFILRALEEGNSEIDISGTIAKDLGFKEFELNAILNVNRRISDNNNLSALGATVGTFDKVFDKDEVIYTLTVPAGTEEVTLVGALEDIYASVEGLTTYKLDSDKTVANIIVTAEDGSIKTYVVYIVREAKSEPITYFYSTNNYLKLLEIEGHDIDFDKNKFEYEITVENVTSLDITAVAEDSRSRVVITGNENFKEGENVVTITVTAENGTSRDYKIIVNKVTPEKVEAAESSNTTEKIVIIILIILVVLGLLYLIFKKDEEQEVPVTKNNFNDKKTTPQSNKNTQINNKSNNNKNKTNNQKNGKER